MRGVLSGGLVLFCALLASCGGGPDDPSDSRPDRENPCRELAAAYVAGYQEIVAAQAGASIEEFAQEGFLAASDETQEKLSSIEQSARDRNCDPKTLITAVLMRGHEIEEQGAGGALTKGLLLAQASNAWFYGPGGTAATFKQSDFEGTPSDSGALETLDDLDFDSIGSCPEAADALLLTRQAELDWIAELSPEEAIGTADPGTGPSVIKAATENMDEVVKQLGCEMRSPRLFLERADHLEAIGFFPNATKAEWVKQAWLDIEEKLVDPELGARALPSDPVPAGETAQVEVEVSNRGDVPLFAITVSNLVTGSEPQPVPLSEPELDPGQSEIVDLPVAVPEDARGVHEIQIQVDAQTPFGRVTFTSVSEELPIR